ncbi:hypothetical protein J6590_028160 [Homalodisca vitripennis]|nr:hypothetical protein J6590_028160 [Homalodisca vitripennis]
MWALLLVHICQNWGSWILGTMLPIYFHHVFAYNMNNHVVVSTLPYIIKCLLTIAFSCIVDFTHENNLMSIKASRRVWNSIAYWGGAVGLIGLSVFTSVQGSLVLLIFTVSINAGMFPGFLSNHLDLAPNFSGLLMGITSGFSTFASILAPTITGFIITSESEKDQWAHLFFVSAVTFSLETWSSSNTAQQEVQSWNQPLKYGVDIEGLEFDDISVPARRTL